MKIPLFLLGLLLSFGSGACESWPTWKKEKIRKDPEPSEISVNKKARPILVGQIASMTGSESTFGNSTHNGVRMALAKVNRKGGVRGRPVRVLLMDDKGEPEIAGRSLEMLISDRKIVAVIGAEASSRSIEMAPIAQKNQIPMITPSSTHPSVSKVGNFVFRVCFVDPFQGASMASFLVEDLKVKKAAVLRDVQNQYSRGLASFFKEKFVEMGGQIVAIQSYNAHDVDFTSQLVQIKNAKPDVVYVPGYYGDVGIILQQARKMKMNAIFAGGDGWDSEKLPEIAGEAIDGTYFTTHYSTEQKNPNLREFVTEYKHLYGAVPDAQAALGYDAMTVLIQAMLKAKSFSGKDLQAALAITHNHPGVTGSITIDKDGNALKPVVALRFKDGRPFYVKTIRP